VIDVDRTLDKIDKRCLAGPPVARERAPREASASRARRRVELGLFSQVVHDSFERLNLTRRLAGGGPILAFSICSAEFEFDCLISIGRSPGAEAHENR
jgi:hypothetical protein